MKSIFWIILISTIFAQSPFDWQDNGVPLRQGTHIEWWKAIEIGNEGELIIVWSDCRYGIRDIFAQKVTTEGELLWGTDGELVALEDGLKDGIPIAQADGRQEDPIIITDDAGGFYMIWMDYRNEPAKGDIYGQHVFADGTLQFGLEGTPITNVAGKQSSPNMCKDNLGGVFAIWVDESDGVAVVKGTHISFDGTILNPGTGITLNNSSFSRSGVSLEVIGDGLAGMTWSRSIPVGADEDENKDIYIQIMDINCNTILSEPSDGGIPICEAPFIQTSPKVTYVNGEQFVVAWQDHRSIENFGDIFMQYIDLDGNILLEQDGVGIAIADGEQIKPRVKGDDSGTYLVWQDYRHNPDRPDIYAHKIDLDGIPILNENGLRITAFDEQYQINPRLTSDGNGGAYFIWEDFRNGAFPEVDVFVQHLNSDNELTFEDNGILVNAENSLSPVLKNDGNGGVFAAWDDYRIGSNSIYLQRITPESGTQFEDNGMKVFAGITGNVGDPDTDSHINSIYVEDGKTLIYWIDNRWAPELQEVTFGMIIDSNYDEPINWTNGVPLCLNPSQGDPQIAYLNGHFLLTFMVESAYTSIYYQLLDENLNMIGGEMGTPIIEDVNWSMESPKIINGEDNSFYISYSAKKHGPQSIFVQKFSDIGVPVWEENGIEVSDYTNAIVDQHLIDIQQYPNGGIIISWQAESWLTGYNIFVKAIDSNGNTIEGWEEWGTSLVNDTNIKNNPVMEMIGNDIYFGWEDLRNGYENGIDIFGQIISLEGQLKGPENGFPIVTGFGGQEGLSVAFNPTSNEVYNCWEDYRDGLNYNIYCNTLNLENLNSESEVLISDDIGDQISPDVILGSDESFIVVWEDERNTPPGEDVALEKDVYFQHVINGIPEFEGNGYPLCNELYKQSKPVIFSQTPEQNSFYMVWMDLRSTGKEDLKNIYAQSISITEEGNSITANIPIEFKINGVYPNPFNPETHISYSIPEHANVKIEIINILGQTIEVIFDEFASAGNHQLKWQPTELGSGSYFIKVNYNDEFSQIQKVSFIK
ncbi:MAG: T9SS type A sorting domain-containing protein [Candidatus Marinimicrobia bacterium]|nr:T9SS type A sorting domain-containing protein [Candidatus Neomarinimicrobiota bacterium]